MLHLTHQFFVELYDSVWQALGRTPLDADWLPVLESAHFAGIRQQKLPAVMTPPPAELLPVWHAELEEPFVRGITIRMTGEDGTASESTVPFTYFKAEARRASVDHVASGRLKAGDVFHYRLVALRKPAAPQAAQRDCKALDLDFEDVPQPLPIATTPEERFAAGAVTLGSGELDGEWDIPVYAPQVLIEQALEQVRAARELETAGTLLGRLHRDTNRPGGVFLELTAQIPARHTEAREMKVTFTQDTWAAARDALRARGNPDESIVGWWHSHPNWCANCTPDKQRDCKMAGIFFSADDCALHRTVFPRAWMVGLLFSVRQAGTIPALFGWRRGQIVPRPFQMHAPQGRRVPPALLQSLGMTSPQQIPQATIGGQEHASSY